MSKHTTQWLIVCGVLLALVHGFFFVYVPAHSAPSEDAAMLYQYSVNLADTGRISYVVNGPRAEGGTDFLWMVLLAVCHKMGLSAYVSATLLSGAALLMSAWTLMRLGGQRSIGVFLLAWLALLAVPQVFAGIQGFSPLVFGLCILLCLESFVARRPMRLSVSAIITCLVRPDGVVFAVPIVLAYLVLNPRAMKKNLWMVAGLCVVPGLVYFGWRSWYFGHLFPLPFYVKSSFDRYALLFNRDALLLNVRFLLALSPMLWVAGRRLCMAGNAAQRRETAVLAGCMLGIPFIFYSAMQLEQNLAYRFEYPFVLLSLALLAVAFRARVSARRVVVAALVSLTLMGPWYAVEGIRTLSMPSENIPAISRAMAALPCRGLIATTEAGRLPFYSGWPTVDLWGLNTAELSQTLVTPDAVRRYDPALVVLHPLKGEHGDDYRFLSAETLPLHTERSWMHMVENVYSAVREGDYALLMVPHMATPDSPRPLAGLVRMRRRLQKRLGYAGSFDVYYAFFVRRDAACHGPLVELLERHGAIGLAEYNGLKQAFVTQQDG